MFAQGQKEHTLVPSEDKQIRRVILHIRRNILAWAERDINKPLNKKKILKPAG